MSRKSFSFLCENQCRLNRSRSAQHTWHDSRMMMSKSKSQGTINAKVTLQGDEGNNCCPITSDHQSSALVTTHTLTTMLEHYITTRSGTTFLATLIPFCYFTTIYTPSQPTNPTNSRIYIYSSIGLHLFAYNKRPLLRMGSISKFLIASAGYEAKLHVVACVREA